MPKIVGKLIQVLMSTSKSFFRGNQHLSEKARGRENIYFLKLQREQLKSLRQRILSQKNDVTLKMIKVDAQIQTLEKATQPDDRNKFKISDS